MKITGVAALLVFLLSAAYATDRKSVEARRATSPPKIDGVLDDDCWSRTLPSFQFIQTNPANGSVSPYKTGIEIIYTDASIFIAARLYDDPRKILREFGRRDDDNRNADYFGVAFDTYNSGQNAFAFVVSAAGVQLDTYFTADDDDENWDAVWNSVVKIDDEGWTVEMEIPYFALRFPKQTVQTWGINFYRQVKRDQEESFWNHVDRSISGFANQFGTLHGIENIEPPLRLSFYPYLSSIFNHDSSTGRGEFSLAGGMDLKFGINESYTLDFSLIPDFTQVQSDNRVYNLSPFEVQFAENRAFFTEGTELFNKGNLFYSRRVGATFARVQYDSETETVVNRPQVADLVNAIKISGRDKRGLGIGFFNAVTDRTFAEIFNKEDSSTYNRQVDPLTNFNMVVVDQNLKNNSNINFTNTNVTRDDRGRDANVTGLSLSLRDKNNIFQLRTFGAVNIISDTGKIPSVGYKYTIDAGKVSGTWQYGIIRNVESYDYNINDLGYLQAPNEVTHRGWVSYNIFKPVGKINNLSVASGFRHQALHKPKNQFTGFSTFLDFNTQFKNFWSLGLNVGGNPVTGYDYFEPRSPDFSWYQIQLPSWDFNVFVETDNRKALYLNFYKGRWERPAWQQQWNWAGVFARYRFTDKFSLFTELNVENGNNAIGYAFETRYNDNGNIEEIIFGQREIEIFNNVLGARLTMTDKMGLNLRIRHYWSTVQYEKFFSLGRDGGLEPTSFTGRDENGEPFKDVSYNAFNVDMVFFWQVAPGSFLNIVWKESIDQEGALRPMNYGENLSRTLRSPQLNSISIRLTYFIDYLRLRQGLSRL